MDYDKPFKTFEEQVSFLKNHHKLIIGDENFAKKVLSTIPYYDLVNGYKECMFSENHFKDNVSFEFLYMFYLFDKRFQNILFKQSLFIENSFKTKLAYVLAENFGVHQDMYLDNNHYKAKKGKLLFSDVKNNIKALYTVDKKYTGQPTRHYIENHNHIPPWILFKNLSFSNVINLFALLKPNEKNQMVNLMKSDLYVNTNSLDTRTLSDFFLVGLNIVRNYRNQIAHNLKFVTYRHSKKLSLKLINSIFPSYWLSTSDIYKKGIGHNDIFSMISIISYLINDIYLESSFLDELLDCISAKDMSVNELIKDNLFKSYAEITNLPIDLKQRIYQRKDYLLKISG